MLYYVKIVIGGLLSEVFYFDNWKEAREYALTLKQRKRGTADIWIGQDGEGAVKL
jgi:hypothetical protein